MTKFNQSAWVWLFGIFLWGLSGVGQAAVILQYHHIGEEFPESTSVSLDRFRQHMEYISRHQFQVLALPDMVARLRRGESLPDKAVAITFDDAYSSVLTNAYPLLRARGWPFAVFVNSDAVDDGVRGVMTWTQLQSMKGAALANHTASHAHLIRLKTGETRNQWRDRVRHEIRRAEQRIREETGQSHKILAYPYGEYDWPLLELVEQLGFAAVGQQSGAIGLVSDLRALPRFPFAGHYGAFQDFADKINSVPLPVIRVGDGNVPEKLPSLVLSPDKARPQLYIELAHDIAQRLNCFASGQGQISVALSARGAIVSVHRDLLSGRSRINCTAPVGDGRYYWYSHPFIKPLVNGGWYEE